MSWIEKIQDQMVIITGDQKQFEPQWLNANLAKEYNIASFNFIDISGTLVHRRQPKGRTYRLEIYFQGDDHLDVARDFERSADDPRRWTIRHPLYGDLTVHPANLLFDNSQMNVSKITGVILETIDDVNPQALIVPEDKIIQDKIDTDEVTAASYVNSNTEPEVKDLALMNDSLDQWEVFTGSAIDDDEEAETFRNKVSRARSDITNAVGEPLAAIRSMQEVINFPSQISATVQLRLRTLLNEFQALVDGISVVTRRADKFLFENNAGGMITAMTVAVATPQSPDDYGNKPKVIETIDIILDAYDLYLVTLDIIQTDDSDELDSYVPDNQAMQLISSLVNFSLSNLFIIALNAKQERSIILEEDSNLINLAHRFYSLDLEDENIDELILNNNIGISEHLIVKKGRIIRYYV